MTDRASATIEVLLFDLGGVLVDFDGVEGLSRLLPAPLTPEVIEARWQRCPHSLGFGSGAMTAEAFTDAFMRDWGITVSRDTFVETYRSWARGLLPGARELLEELRPHYRLAALSNSNPMHWEALMSDAGFASLFELVMSSHQVGYRKPAAEMYEAALDRLQVAPEVVLFLDDAPGNVDAARRLGFEADRVDGVEGARRAITARGLLPE